jgi:DNA-binding LacI/PurR family transcriptional regulator
MSVMAEGGRGYGSGRRPTVKDVAERAGVSASTVSNVLHDHPNITAEKRARVEAAIAEVGYRPSFAGRQLRNGRSHTLALAIPDIRSPYFADLAHTLILEAGRRGLTVLIDETGGSLDREREIAAGYPSRGIEGVIFCPVSISAEELEQLKSDIPTVLLGEHVAGGSFDHIAIDSRRSAEDATEHLLSTGRSRLAFVGDAPGRHSGPGFLRLAGTRHVLAEHDLAVPDDLVLETAEWTREEGERVAESLIAHIDRIDALVCAADLLAIGVLKAFSRAGIRVPHDIAILAWDDSPEGRFSTPALTTVAHDLGSIAALAVDSVLTRQEETSLPPRQYVVPHHLIVRESTVAA